MFTTSALLAQTFYSVDVPSLVIWWGKAFGGHYRVALLIPMATCVTISWLPPILSRMHTKRTIPRPSVRTCAAIGNLWAVVVRGTWGAVVSLTLVVDRLGASYVEGATSCGCFSSDRRGALVAQLTVTCLPWVGRI